MDFDKPLAIIAPGAAERASLRDLLTAEGFAVEAYSHPKKFVSRYIHSTDTRYYGCLIIDLDHSADNNREPSLVDFSSAWSRKLPCIVIASDRSLLPSDPLLPTVTKASGATRLLYLVYGAMGEPAAPQTQTTNPC